MLATTGSLFLTLLGRSASSPIPASKAASSTLPSPRRPSFTDLSRLNLCLAQVETGNNDSRIGPGGERSRFQIGKSVWSQHRPRSPFASCRGAEAAKVAVEHLEWLRSHAGIPDLPYSLALAWRVGATATLQHRSQPRHHDYALRVENIYYDRT